MKRFSVALVCLISASYLYAGEWATSEGSCFAKGNKSVGAGIGMLWLGGFVSGDYAFHDAISAGIAMGYNGRSLDNYRNNYIPFYARAAFHPFNLKVLSEKISIRDKLDPYAGIAAGWNIGWVTNKKDKYKKSDADSRSPVRELLGVKFYPTNKFFLIAEEGGGLSVFNIGAGMNF